jgi:hypothetical protein
VEAGNGGAELANHDALDLMRARPNRKSSTWSMPVPHKLPEAMTNYAIILHWSGGDDAFIAEVPEPAGCATEPGRSGALLARVKSCTGRW